MLLVAPVGWRERKVFSLLRKRRVVSVDVLRACGAGGTSLWSISVFRYDKVLCEKEVTVYSAFGFGAQLW